MNFIKDTYTTPRLAGKCGGKAQSLFHLLQNGFQVPSFLVIPVEESLAFIPQKLLAEKNYNAIRSCIESFQFPENFTQEIQTHFPTTTFFAVRSSAADEDGSNFSFAGQFETKLFVTANELEQAIKSVWLSAWSERVQQYREFNKLEPPAGIAVIIQQMINADVAGVAFSINPITGHRNQQVISAVYGLGEGLVSGELDADTFTVEAQKIIDQTIAQKTHRISFDTATQSGTKMMAVEQVAQTQITLIPEQILALASKLKDLQNLYQRPVDIEFAFAKNTFYLLQARPVTTINRLPDPQGEYVVWDNSNIIESYPGLSSPLTFSFILRMYEAVYLQFSSMMGISEKERNAHANTYANMLGLLDGRVYYNLRSWYKLLSLLPGYSLNAGFMEKMMGVKERFELHDYVPRTKFRERIRILNMISIMLGNMRRLPKMRRDFETDFEAVMQRFEKIDFHTCHAWTLMRLYMEFEQTLLKKWKAPLVNDFFAMIWYGTLQKLTLKYKLDENGTLHNDLLCGAKDIISTEPVQRCKKMVLLIRENPDALNLFEESSAGIWAKLNDKKYDAIKAEMDAYISKWGDRTVGELKLETITYRQQPELLVRVLQSYLRQNSFTQAEQHIDQKLRLAAEQIVQEKLRGKLFKKLFFNFALRKTRDLVSNRENLRFARTRGFGMVRRIFLALGERFYAEDLIDHSRDIFWLKKEEVFDFIQGTSPTRNLRTTIALRKNEYAEFEKRYTAERIPTRGVVYQANDFTYSPQTQEALTGDLKGIGCCPGRIRARIRVVHNPHEVDDLAGDILVTASTDPGWVTLFPTASAILVERGSLLSHSAIVSREMGIPCIVGITGLLQRVKTGDVVEMDGSSGDIKLITS
jgi:rifampicin phosphotransferase